MTPQIHKTNPVTLSAERSVTRECIADALKAFGSYIATADRLTGNFSVTDGGEVQCWQARRNLGDGGTFVVNLAVDADASREDVLAAVGSLAETVSFVPKPVIEPPAAPKPVVVSVSAPQHIREYTAGPIRLTYPVGLLPDYVAAAFRAFCRYAENRDLNGAYSVASDGRVRDWSTPGHGFGDGESYPLNAHVEIGVSRDDVAKALDVLSEQFNPQPVVA